MKLTPLLLGGLLLTAFIAGCSHDNKEPAAAAKSESAAEPESRVKRGTNGLVVVTLNDATQKLMGLQTAALAAAQLNPETKAYGRVLDVSPLASLLAELSTAQAASAASQAELQRLKTLTAQNNASQRSLQAAEAAAARDRTQVEAAQLHLVAAWGSALAERKDLPALVRSISSLNAALVELDLPAGQVPAAMPTGARLFNVADETKPIPAQLMGPAPQVDLQMQGRGFLFLVSPNADRLAPGATLTGLLSLPGEPQSGVVLPRSAVLRFNGTTWVYVQTGNDAFERREVPLGAPLPDGWFVQGTLKPGDKVVTVATQQLLSEELKGQGGE